MLLPLTPAESALIATATTIIDAVPRFGPQRQSKDHLVGCAVLSSTGRVFTGVNVSHFTGGPCAEQVAFGSAAAAGVASRFAPGIEGPDGGHETLVCCVAVANDQRGVVSPCGKCRQIMLDYHPAMRVIVVVGAGELRTITTDELLPFAYIHALKPPAVG